MALGHFGVIVVSLWGDFGVMWGALWAYGSAIDSPGVSLRLLCCHFGSSVGSLLAYECVVGAPGGCFGVTLSSL